MDFSPPKIPQNVENFGFFCPKFSQILEFCDFPTKNPPRFWDIGTNFAGIFQEHPEEKRKKREIFQEFWEFRDLRKESQSEKFRSRRCWWSLAETEETAKEKKQGKIPEKSEFWHLGWKFREFREFRDLGIFGNSGIWDGWSENSLVGNRGKFRDLIQNWGIKRNSGIWNTRKGSSNLGNVGNVGNSGNSLTSGQGQGTEAQEQQRAQPQAQVHSRERAEPCQQH